MPLRVDVTSADTFLTTFEYNNPDYLAIAKKFSDGVNGVVHDEDARAKQLSQDIISPVLAFWGKAADNATTDYRVYGRRRGPGPIETIAQGVITLGTQLITVDPITRIAEVGRWADTITETGEWIKAVTATNAGNNGISYLGFNAFGLEDIAVMFDLSTGGTDATEMNCIITGA